MKIPKTISVLLTITIVASSSGLTNLAYAQTPRIKEEKLIGKGRWETAIEISKKGWTTTKQAVIVNDNSIVDALAATPLAKSNDAPILLTGKDKLDERTKIELKRLGINKVYLIGGEAVLSQNIEKELKALNIQIDRINGKTREHTALEIANRLDKIKDVSEIAVVNGYKGIADAVSIAAAAAQNNIPIVLANSNSGVSVFNEFIKLENIKTSYVIGGEAVVSKEIKDSLPNVNNIFGKNRNETNAKVIEKFYTNRYLNNVYVAKDGIKGEGQLIDALSVGVLASKNSSPVMIVGDKLSEGQVAIGKEKKFTVATQVGGNGNENAYQELIKLQNSQGSSGGSGGSGGVNPPVLENQEAPIGLVVQNETGLDLNDGKITGLLSDKIYEYKKLSIQKTTNEYIKVNKGSTEITSLEPGTYNVRFAATSTHKASEPVPVTINEWKDESNPQPDKTPLEKLEEQIRDILKNVCESINKTNVNANKVHESIANIESILKDDITPNEILTLISSIKDLSRELSKININDEYFNNQLHNDLMEVCMTLHEVLVTSEKLQVLKQQIQEEIKKLEQGLVNLVKAHVDKINEMKNQLEEAKVNAKQEVIEAIEKVQAELDRLLECIKNGKINKEEVQSTLLVLEEEQSKISATSPEVSQKIDNIKEQLEAIKQGIERIESVINSIENLIASINKLDTTSIKGFVNTALVEVGKLPESQIKTDLMKSLGDIKKAIDTYELVQETLYQISQTNNPLEIISIIAKSGLISKETIEEAKKLVNELEVYVSSLPESDLKPVAQLGVTSIKLVIELVEKNQDLGNLDITNVQELIKFLLQSDSITVETLRQGKQVLQSFEKIIDQLPDDNAQISTFKAEAKKQLKVYYGLIDTAIVAGEIEEMKEKIEKSLSKLNEALGKLSDENLTKEGIDKAQTALDEFKATITTGNIVVDTTLELQYASTIKNAESTIKEAQSSLKGTGMVSGKVSERITSIIGIGDVTITIKNDQGSIVDTINTSSETLTLGSYNVELKAGSYSFEFSKEGYKTIVKSVTVTKGQTENVDISLELDKKTVTVGGVVTTKRFPFFVEGVDIKITNSNGNVVTTKTKELGAYSIELEAGDYIFEYSKVGFDTLSKNVTVKEGQVIDNVNATLVKQTGKLEVFIQDNGKIANIPFVGTKPVALSGAKIEILEITDSEEKYQSDTSSLVGIGIINDIPTGKYKLTVSKEGYITQTKEIDIKQGKNDIGTIDLKK